MISIALLCLSNCGDSEPFKNSNDLIVEIKCLNHTENIITRKPLVGVETFEIEKFAVLTDSNGKTHIHLDKVGLDCAATNPDFFRINYAVDGDTLKLNGVYKYNIRAGCGGCTSPLDFTIESMDDGIKYVVYNEDYSEPQIFQVKRQ